MKNIPYLFLMLLIPLFTQAQYSIKVQASELETDTLLLGYFHGKNQFVMDTAFRQGDMFLYEDDERSRPGLYFFYVPHSDKTMQFIIDGQKSYNITVTKSGELSFSHSPQNTAFYNYIEFLNRERQALKDASVKGMDSIALVQFQIDTDKAVEVYQAELMAEYKDSLFGKILNLNRNIDIPTFAEAGAESDQLRFNYYVEHYFDYIDLKDNRLIYVPGLYSKVKRYLEDYTVQNPDSIIKAVDRVLSKTDSSGANFKYFLIDFLNTYGTSEVIGMDAVYVHLIKAYYNKGMAPWVNENQLKKLAEAADKLDKILIGKKAPPIDMQLRDGTVLPLYDIETDFTVLFFWTPECGHCKKSIPKLVDKFQEFKEKGVTLYAVCTELGEDAVKCWEYIDEHPEMKIFINVNDPYMRSGFKRKYDITYTPQFYLLDRNKEILLKRFGAEQLSDVLEHFTSRAGK